VTPLPAIDPVKSGFSNEGVERIDEFFATEIAGNRLPGAVLAVAHHGKLAIYKSYGYLDPVSKSPMPLNAVFNLASMTKVMATVGAMSIYEEGKLPLNAPVSNWFEEFKSAQLGVVKDDGTVSTQALKRPITVQDLLRHTNGLTYGERGNTPIHKMFPGSSAKAAFAMDGKAFITQLAKTPLLYEPGTAWDYGFGLDVMGLIEEKIDAQPLEQVLRKRVWSKLNMTDTTFHLNENQRARLAKPLPIDPLTGLPQSIPILDTPIHFDCAGSCAFGTAGDYVRFGQMLLGKGELDQRRVLSPNTVKMMTSDHLGNSIKNNVASTEPGRAGYGFGLGVAVRTQRGVAAINGNVGEFTWNGANGTIFWVDPVEEMVVVMMAASPGESRKVYREKLAAVIYGALVN
jgi:CubicO group peptidase (beta-lactamase class C family)